MSILKSANLNIRRVRSQTKLATQEAHKSPNVSIVKQRLKKRRASKAILTLAVLIRTIIGALASSHSFPASPDERGSVENAM